MAATGRYRPTTVGDLANQNMDVWAWCNGYFKDGARETGPLITRLGRGFPVPDVGARCIAILNTGSVRKLEQSFASS